VQLYFPKENKYRDEHGELTELGYLWHIRNAAVVVAVLISILFIASLVTGIVQAHEISQLTSQLNQVTSALSALGS
jgi:hypothetical protein